MKHVNLMAAILTSFIIGVIKVHYDRSKKPVQLIRFNLFPATPATRLTVLESGNNFANIKSFSRVTAGKFSYVIRNDTNLRVRNIFCSKEESRSLWNLSLFFSLSLCLSSFSQGFSKLRDTISKCKLDLL